MGNIINPEWYIIKNLSPQNFSQINEIIFDPTIRNPYIRMLFIPIGFIFPGIIFFGIITNFLTIVQMGRRDLKINSSARLFYLFIGVADIGNNLSNGLGLEILMDAMYIWTDKMTSLSTYPKDYTKIAGEHSVKDNQTESTSITEFQSKNIFSFLFVIDGIFWCKILVLIGDFTMYCSTYGVLAFSLERFTAIYFPFWAMRSRSQKLSIILLVICILPPCIILLPYDFIAFSSVSDPTWSFTEFTCTDDPENPLYEFGGIALVVALLTHVTLNSILVIAIVIKIRKSSQMRKTTLGHMGQSSTASSSLSSEFSTSLTLVLVACVNIVSYGVFSLFWICYILAETWLLLDSNTELMVGTLSRIFYCLMNVPQCVNFLVYLAVIPSFRKSFVTCCGYLGSSISKATSSTDKQARPSY